MSISPALPSSVQAAVASTPFRFPGPDEWVANGPAHFESDLRATLAAAGLELPADQLPAARFGRLVSSLAYLPRQEKSLFFSWAARLVNDVLQTQPGLVGSGAAWSYPSGMTGSMLSTLLAMRVYADPTVLAPHSCKRLLTSLRQHHLADAHADLRQDGQAGALLWLDDLCRRSDMAPGTKKHGSAVLDTVWTNNMALDVAFCQLGQAGQRGDDKRTLLGRLAVRAGEAGAPEYIVAKPGDKISDEAWRLRPFKLLAESIVGWTGGSGSPHVVGIEQTLQALAAISGVDAAAGARRFGHDFCQAVTGAAQASTWNVNSCRLLGPKLIRGPVNVVGAVVGAMRSMRLADHGFFQALRDAYFSRSPNPVAGAAFNAYIAECEMRLCIEAGDLRRPAASEPAPARRRPSV